MLEKGLTEDGTATALGWPKQRVTARMKLLELPDRAQQLTGQGVIPLAAVDQLRTIGQVSPKLLDVLVEHVASENGGWVARQLATDPGRALADALRHSDIKTFAAYLTTVSQRELEELRLGRKPASSSPRWRSFTARSTVTRTGRRRSGSPTTTSTRPAPLAW